MATPPGNRASENVPLKICRDGIAACKLLEVKLCILF
jgi:hypothetical protein